MINPLARAAMLARQSADALRSNPALADVATDDYAKAAEQLRLARVAERTRKQREEEEQAVELARRAAAFDAAVEQHTAAEVAEKTRLAKIEKAVDAADKRMSAEVTAAVKALSAALAATHERDQVVAEAARELLAASLPASYQDGDVHHEFEVGATRDGRVLVGGRWRLPVDPDAVALRVLYAAARARTGDHRGLGAQLRMDPRVRKVEHQSAGVLPSLPPPFVPGTPDWMVELRETRAAIQGAPVFMTDDRREVLERERATEAKRDQNRDAAARRDYATARAQLVADRGEAHVVELERRIFIDGEPFRDEVPA